MARIETRYGIGDDVKYFTGIKSKVTAIYHRGGKNAYEFSYLQGNDILTSCNCEECELENLPNGSGMAGFKK